METRPSIRQTMILLRTFGLLFFILNISIQCSGSFSNEGTFMTLFSPVKNGSLPSSSFVMPTIFWDPRNPLFNCPGKGTNTINLRLNDYIRLACPKPGRFISWHNSLNVPHNEMFENAFITTNKTAMDQCMAHSSWLFLLKCSDPVNKNIYRTVRVAQHSGSDADPLFTYNTTYYVFATATGFSSGLENRAGGRCSSSGGDTYEMKLKLRVCPKGEAGTAKCPVCMDSACYNSGCGTYSEWKETNRYQRIDNKCHIVHKRSCDYLGGSCDGPSEKLVETDIANCVEPSKIPDYNFTNSYVKKNGTCYAVFNKTCSQGTNGIIVTGCKHDLKYVKVYSGFCEIKRPVAAARCAEEPKTVSLVVGIFIVVLIAIGVTCLLFGIVLGAVFAKKKVTIRSVEERCLRRPRKNELC